MGKANVSVIAAALACLVSVPAAAQIPTSNAEMRPNHASDAKIRGAIELDRLVKCAMSRRENLARNIIRSRPGSNAEDLMISQFREVEVNCMNEQAPAMWLGNSETRGAIAQSFYLRQYPASPDFSAMTHPVAPLPDAWTKGQMTEYERHQVLGADLADCVVSASPADADALIRTELRSALEHAVFRKIVPTIGPCLPKGLKMELDVAWLRAVVAEALFRNVDRWQNSVAPSVGGSS